MIHPATVFPVQGSALRFAGRTRPVGDPPPGNAYFRNAHPPLPFTVATLELGGSGVRLLALSPDGKVTKKEEAYENARSNKCGKKGVVNEALEKFTEAMQAIGHKVRESKTPIRYLQVVGTSGLRDAANQDVLKRIIADSIGDARGRKLDEAQIRTIDGSEEGRLSCAAVTFNEGIRHGEKLAVLEIGSGSTEVSFTTGRFGFEQAKVFKIGHGNLGIHNPWDSVEIEQARRQAREKISAGLGNELAEWQKQAEGRRAFVKSSTFKALQPVHVDKGYGKEIEREAINANHLRDYLSVEGLRVLSNHAGLMQALCDDRDKSIKLVSRMIIAEELLRALNLSELELGYKGGIKYQLLDEHIAAVRASLKEKQGQGRKQANAGKLKQKAAFA